VWKEDYRLGNLIHQFEDENYEEEFQTRQKSASRERDFFMPPVKLTESEEHSGSCFLHGRCRFDQQSE
jgi:hypothetical protein